MAENNIIKYSTVILILLFVGTFFNFVKMWFQSNIPKETQLIFIVFAIIFIIFITIVTFNVLFIFSPNKSQQHIRQSSEKVIDAKKRYQAKYLVKEAEYMINLKQYDVAVVFLKDALKFDPTNGSAYLKLALAQKAIGEDNKDTDMFKESLYSFEKALFYEKKYSKNPMIHLLKASLFLKLKKPLEAKKELEHAQKLSTSDKDINKRIKEALKEINQA